MKNKTSTIYTSNLLIHHRFVSIKRRKKESKKNYTIITNFRFVETISSNSSKIPKLVETNVSPSNGSQVETHQNPQKSPRIANQPSSSSSPNSQTGSSHRKQWRATLVPGKTSRVRLDRERCVVARSHFRLEHPATLTHIRIHIRASPATPNTCWPYFWLVLAGVGRFPFCPQINGTALRSLFDKRSRGVDRSIDRSMDEKPLAAGIGGMRKKINAAVAPMTSDIRFRARQNEQGFSACTPLRSFPFHAL